MLIDTHTHLYSKELEADIAEVIQRAIASGVERFYLPNIDVESLEPMFKLCEAYPEHCFPMLGLHPCSVDANYKETLKTIFEHKHTMPYAAIGEIGIDMYWDKTHLAEQQYAFNYQIDVALEMDLPIAIHCREAYNYCMEIVKAKQNGKLRGVFHCFGGSVAEAEEIIDQGLYIGIGGVLTYAKSGLDKTLEAIDLKHIVLETDSPYLAPVPMRGKRNESGFLMHIAQRLADVKQISIEELGRITSANARDLYKI